MCEIFAHKRHKGCPLRGSRTARQGRRAADSAEAALRPAARHPSGALTFGCLDLRVPCPKGALASAAGYYA